MCLANISRKNTNYSLGSLWIRLRYQNTKYSAASHSDFTLPPPTLSGVSTSESTRLGTLLIVVSEARREWPYEGENQPVLVSERTSTGHYGQSVLVRSLTSTGCFLLPLYSCLIGGYFGWFLEEKPFLSASRYSMVIHHIIHPQTK